MIYQGLSFQVLCSSALPFPFVYAVTHQHETFGHLVFLCHIWRIIGAICINQLIKSLFWRLHRTGNGVHGYRFLTLVLLNPDIPCLCKQFRSRSVGFWRSQLIVIWTVYHSVCEFIATIWFRESDWLGWQLEVGVAPLFIQYDQG